MPSKNSFGSPDGFQELERRDMPSFTPFTTEPALGPNPVTDGWSGEKVRNGVTTAIQGYTSGVFGTTNQQLVGVEGDGQLEMQTVTPKFEIEIITNGTQLRVRHRDFPGSPNIDLRCGGSPFPFTDTGEQTFTVAYNVNYITQQFWIHNHPSLPQTQYAVFTVTHRHGYISEVRSLATNAAITTGSMLSPVGALAHQTLVPARNTAPLIVKNTGPNSVNTPLGFPINPGEVVVRPGRDEVTKFKWVSPVTGLASIKSVLKDLETTAGDGVSYKLTHTTRVLSEKTDKLSVREDFLGPLEVGMNPEKLVRFTVTRTRILASGLLLNGADEDITKGGMDLLMNKGDIFEIEINPIGTLNSMADNKGDATRLKLEIKASERPRELNSIEQETLLKQATEAAIIEEHQRMQLRTYELTSLNYQFNNTFLQNVAEMCGPWWPSVRDLCARIRPDLYGATESQDEEFAHQYATQHAGPNPPPGEWGFWYNHIIQARFYTREFVGDAKPIGWEVIKRSLDLTFTEVLKEKMGQIPHASGVVGHYTGEANAYNYLPMPTAADYEAKIRAVFNQCYDMRRCIAQDQAVDQERVNFLANRPSTAEERAYYEQQEAGIRARLGPEIDRTVRRAMLLLGTSSDPRIVAIRYALSQENVITRVDSNFEQITGNVVSTFKVAMHASASEILAMNNPSISSEQLHQAASEVIPSYEQAYSEALSWYSNNISRPGYYVRDNTVVGRLFLGLLHKFKNANDIERTHLSKVVEKITNIPFEKILAARVCGVQSPSIEENMKANFLEAQYVHIFSAGEVNGPEVITVQPNRTDYSAESTIKIRFDVSIGSQNFSHAKAYVWQNGVQTATQVPVGEEIKHRLFVEIPVSKASEQLIFSPMDGRPKIQIGIITWTPQPSPNQSLPMITRVAKSEEIVVPMNVVFDLSTNSDLSLRLKENIALTQLAKNFPLDNAANKYWLLSSGYHDGDSGFHSADLNSLNGYDSDRGDKIYAIADGVIKLDGYTGNLNNLVQYGALSILHTGLANGQSFIWKSNYLHAPVFDTGTSSMVQVSINGVLSEQMRAIYEVRRQVTEGGVIIETGEKIQIWDDKVVSSKEHIGFVGGRDGYANGIYDESLNNAHLHLQVMINGKAMDLRQALAWAGMTVVKASDGGADGNWLTTNDNKTLPVTWLNNLGWVNNSEKVVLDRKSQQTNSEGAGVAQKWLAWQSNVPLNEMAEIRFDNTLGKWFKWEGATWATINGNRLEWSSSLSQFI